MDRDLEAPAPTSRLVSRGELYWVRADETRGSVPGEPHPHLVVSEDLFNHSRIGTVVVCRLTSNLARANEPGNVLLDVGEGGLPKRSVVVVSHLSSLYKARLGELLGVLSQERVELVLSGLRMQQASFFARR
jgi:mRNA interferase MazF